MTQLETTAVGIGVLSVLLVAGRIFVRRSRGQPITRDDLVLCGAVVLIGAGAIAVFSSSTLRWCVPSAVLAALGAYLVALARSGTNNARLRFAGWIALVSGVMGLAVLGASALHVFS